MTSMTETLVIPPDVRLVPVLDLPEYVRNQLDWTEGDFAVTRSRSRTTSRVINGDFARLLDEFRQERTIVEAVLRYSVKEATDPQQILAHAFPLLQQFVGHGLLVPPALVAQSIDRPLVRGEQVDGLTIIRRVRTLQDTEIYQARSADNRFVALKIKQPQASRRIDFLLAHEAKVLRALAGNGAPRLLGQGEWEDRPYLAIEWIQGIDVVRHAQEVRDNRSKLLALCCAVLDGYVAMHARGFMHGDIHPGNILVDGDDSITLIDFGMAHSAELAAAGRGGVAFYYEPEYASAFVAQQRAPQANPSGEQYALAALLYQLITGASYLDFSLEEDVLYQQIIEEPPKSFAANNIEPWPQVEAVLQRALAKDPADRFISLAGFADALRALIASSSPAAGAGQSARLSSDLVVSEILEDLALDGDLLANGLPRSPHASVNFGTAGVAYALYRLAYVRERPDLLALADVWLTRAEMAVGDEAGFYNAELDMGVDKIGLISTYHSPTGVYASRAMLAHAMGDTRSLYAALGQFVWAGGQPCDNLDITLGKAGVVLTSAMLIEMLADAELAAESGVLQLGNSLLDGLWKTIDSYQPIGPACELNNLGVAHGWAGLLLTTLRWHEATGAKLPDALLTRLDQLAQQAEATGRGLSWLWEIGREATMSGWCNGSAGYVYLWLAAYRVFHEVRFLQLAVDAAWHVWEDPATVVTLCCGLIGRSYSLLHLSAALGDDSWLERARILADRALQHRGISVSAENVGFEMSLYKGDLPLALLHAELDHPSQAIFPFFS
ncbi:MAG: lanthionine synthetase LanC family protein [Caldilinea sp.]